MGVSSSSDGGNYKNKLEYDASKTSHLIVFSHGMTGRCTASDLQHGRALEVALSQFTSEGIELYFSGANASSSGTGTFLWTARCGVAEGGRRLAEEVLSLVESRPQLQRLSFIGGSLGGLFAQQAVGEVVSKLPPTVTLHAFCTLATPHLGVKGLYASPRLLATASMIGMQTTTDLEFSSTVLAEMSDPGGPCMRALASFAVRVLYAPLIDDGIVAWSSSALTGHGQPPAGLCPAAAGIVNADAGTGTDGDVVASVLVEEHEVGGSNGDVNVDEWIGKEEQAYFVGEDNAPRMWGTMCNLNSIPWRIVSVNLPHKKLATLYPIDRRTSILEPATMQVAGDVWRRVLS